MWLRSRHGSACEGGHMETVQMLVDLGADVNKQVSRVVGLV